MDTTDRRCTLLISTNKRDKEMLTTKTTDYGFITNNGKDAGIAAVKNDKGGLIYTVFIKNVIAMSNLDALAVFKLSLEYPVIDEMINA